MSATSKHPAQSPNHLLARLPADEFHRLSALLEPIPLEPKEILYRVRHPMDHVYFPTSGVISAMTVMQDGTCIEVATIGNEGMSGLTAFNGIRNSPYEVM